MHRRTLLEYGELLPLSSRHILCITHEVGFLWVNDLQGRTQDLKSLGHFSERKILVTTPLSRTENEGNVLFSYALHREHFCNYQKVCMSLS